MVKRGLWITVMIILSSFTLAAIQLDQDEISFGEVMFKNTARKDLQITSDSVDLIKIKAELSDNLESIVEIEPQYSLYVTKEAPLVLKITATPILKEEIQGKLYLFFEKVSKGSITSFSDSFLTLGITVAGTDQRQGSLIIKETSVGDAEKGAPLDLRISFDNQKNSQENLQVKIFTEDGEKNFDLQIPALFSGEEHIKIPPSESVSIELLSSDIEETKEIPVKTKDSCLKKIELIDVYAEASDEDAYLATIAKNRGECAVEGEIRQEFFFGGELVKEIKTKEFFPVGKVIRNMNTAEARQGEYLVRTTIYYDNTFTNTEETRFEVTAEGEEIPLAASIWVMLVATTILALIIFKKKKWRSHR